MNRHAAALDFAETPLRLAALGPAADSRAKRALDMLVAAAALLLLLPLMLIVALAVYAEIGGPVLFRQRRVGLGGTVFEILKFRTMHVHEVAEVRQATRDDPRITGVGRILRKLSLDELPQLINVLKGEMSLVGPRPHALAHDMLWAETVPDYVLRYRARPGLTGLAQVQGHRGLITCREEIQMRVAADNAYIDSWTLGSDLKLILRTAPLLFGDAAAF